MRRFNLKNLEEKIIELIEPTINKLGYNLYDIEYLKKGKEYHWTCDSEMLSRPRVGYCRISCRVA